MATAVAVKKQQTLLDLSFLTPEERAKLEAVIRADQNLLTKDRVRVGTLRQELERERYQQKQLLDRPQCTYCQQFLGRVFNSGAPCPNCHFRVCKRCRIISQNPPPPFLCPVCTKKRVLDIQAAEYISLPHSDFSPSPLFGSQLVMMSLDALHTTEPGGVVNPYDGKARKRLTSALSRASSTDSDSQAHQRSGTNESSIVVRYANNSERGRGGGGGGGASQAGYNRSDSIMSWKSDSSSKRERPTTLPQARRISPGDYSDSDDDEEERNVLEVPGLSKLKHSESISSIGSLTSMYSAVGGRGDYAISGEIHLGVCYTKEGILKIHVDQARNLAAARKEGYSYPYVKVYLLPDRSKHTKRKTGFARRTVSPKYDETFKYKISESELSSRTLWVSVWDWDRFGRNQFLGEVRLPLSLLDLTIDSDIWHTLLDQDEAAQLEMEGQYRGRLLLGLMFQLNEEVPSQQHPKKIRKTPRRKGVLHVAIKRAEDLPKMDSHGLTNAVVKCYLLPSRSSSNKRKTQVAMKSLNPAWEEEFTYKTSEKELTGERVLEVTVWDFDKRGSNDFIGGIRIGPSRNGSASQCPDWMDSFGDEVSHWQTVLSCPGEWVEQWHTLRPRMDKSITSLPVKPPRSPHSSRELSPVPEVTSAPVGEDDRAAKEEEKALSNSPPGLIDRSMENMMNEGAAVAKATNNNNAQTVSTRKPSPLMKSRKKQDNEVISTGADSLPLATESPVPSLPHLLVTASSIDDQSIHSVGLSHATSSTSLHSATLDEGEIAKGDYDISGDIQLAFVHQTGKLLVHVVQARGLAAADSNGLSDPYVKTYLLPDLSKHSKRKTGVKKRTLNPFYNETLEYKISASEIQSRTLWLSVWDWDRFGRNQFLGELKLPLSSLDLVSEAELWYPLLDKDQSYSLDPNCSQILISLRFTPRGSEGGVTRGSLSISIKRARYLFPSVRHSTPNIKDASSSSLRTTTSHVSCSLLPEVSSAQRMTANVEGSHEHIWRESFAFDDVSMEEVAKERVLEIVVWGSSHYDNNNDNEECLIGGLRIGPLPDGSSHKQKWMDSFGDEVSHWQTVLSRPGEWVEQWHALRTNIIPTTTTTTTEGHAPKATPPVDEFRKTSPKTRKTAKHDQTTTLHEEFPKTTPTFGKTTPTSNKATPSSTTRPHTSTAGDEFRKVSLKSKSKSSSPAESPILERKDVSSTKPIKRGTASAAGSSSSLPRSIPPLTLEEIARNEDSHRPRSLSPQFPPSSDSASRSSTPEHSTNQIPPTVPLKRTGLLGVKDSGSRLSLGSQLSVYSEAGGGKGDYEITGEVLIGISYSTREQVLSVHVKRALGLAAADSNGYSDPYVKTYLLPDRSKHSKRKTNTQRKTLNPVYNQVLKYTVGQSDLPSRTLWLSVWDWDRFGRNQFLGEVRLPLSSLNLSDTTDRWYTLQDKDEDTGGGDFYRGQLHLALRFTPIGTKKGKTRGSLDVIVKQGRDFPSMGGNEKPDPVVKCYLLPDKSSSGKRKVGIKKSESDPVWEEMVSYEKVVLEELAKERVLEVTVWDWDKKGSVFIGGLRIGPLPDGSSHNREWMDSIGEEVSHWQMVLSHPGEWSEQWHTLRTTMDPRNISTNI